MIEFSIVPPDRGREAYQWHRGFAAQNPHILSRPWSDYERFAADEQIWCARDERGDFLGLAYYAFEENTWELGGLMVTTSERLSGVGSTLVRLLLGHLLYTEDPLSKNHKVIAHVHADNKAVIALAQTVLAFQKFREVEVDWYSTAEGSAETKVRGIELQLVKPDSLVALATWCNSWKNKLSDGKEAKVTFAQKAENLHLWAAAFLDMAR
jgi:hypothetical protein